VTWLVGVLQNACQLFRDMQIKAPDISGVDNRKAIEQTIVNMFNVWLKNDPEQVETFLDHCNDIRSNIHNPNAMSAEGHLLLYGVIPQRMDGMMTYVFGNNWKDDPQVAPVFWNAFSGFRINQTTRLKLEERPTTKDGYHFKAGEVWNPVIREIELLRK
jgi:hypothetical protein